MPRNTLTKIRKDNSFAKSYDPDSSFYRSHKWVTFRAELLRKQLPKDHKQAQRMHHKNKNISGLDLLEYIESGKPLCREYMSKGLIKPADVLDHINPIRQGGSVWDTSNLQWLSHEAHNRKRQSEGKSSGNN